ncbi:hypothetical protein AVEN_260891-1 [Araneus ventricosus]|uniref:Uncharacterized protein n=1 Tax=Araneus ventricosus TaxID=182803 RepID=A0A4Y2HDS4_ARAVE|nr:hypothetical protein AVEN_260891-1 [Araneus ventricosus]
MNNKEEISMQHHLNAANELPQSVTEMISHHRTLFNKSISTAMAYTTFNVTTLLVDLMLNPIHNIPPNVTYPFSTSERYISPGMPAQLVMFLLYVSYRIHLQWVPSHISIRGNESADALAKAGADDASVPSAPLTYLELFSRAKSKNKTIWLIPPKHHWYQGSRPGDSLSIDCNRRDQTTLTRFLSGHIRNLTSSDNSKCFEICPKCTAEQATPDHILACLGLSQQDLVPNPLLTLDLFRVHRLMDMI